LAKHYGIGGRKYGDNNWRLGYDWRLSFSAMMRHAWTFWRGEDIDEETGQPHLTAVAWHAFTLLEYSDIHPEFDSRLMTLDQRSLRDVLETPGHLAESFTVVFDNSAQQKLDKVQDFVKSIGTVGDPRVRSNYEVDMLASAILSIIEGSPLKGNK
jgi:hypothetical protein